MSDTLPQDQSGGPALGRESVEAPLARLAAREKSLWFLALVILTALALGIAALSWPQVAAIGEQPLSWQSLPTFPVYLLVLPVGLVILVFLFGVYAWRRTREMSELRGLVRGLDHGLDHGLDQLPSGASDPGHLEKLFEMIRRSQQGYRDLIDTFEDLLFSISLDGEILAANRSFSDLLGRSFPDMVGHRLDDFLELRDGKGRAAAEAALPRFLEQRHWSGVLRLRLKHDASTRFFQCTLYALVRDGKDQGICVLGRDITRERENEARFTELFETLQEGVYLASSEGKFEDVNPAMASMLGYGNREELLDHPLSDFLFHPDQWQAEQEELNRSGAVQGREVLLRRRDGSPVICLHAAALIRDTAGRVRRHQGTLIDITGRREMEMRLHREQEFARRLVQSFPDLVVALDREGRYTFVSPRVQELLGYSPEELIGMRMSELLDAHDRKQVWGLFEAALAGQYPDSNVEYLIRNKAGDMRLFRATISPLFDSSGQIEGIIASARDITETKRIEQQLIQTERLAAMGQMIAGVAHELNNPLTAVLGITELLQDSATEKGARRQLELAHHQARRAAEIVHNLLSFARPPHLQKSCVQISDLIQRSLQLDEHSLRVNGITVDFLPQPDLPPVLGDASQLTQVFLNLITNAEQAIQEVRDHGSLRIRVHHARGNISASFQDDGVGIAREILPRIFDPFFTTKRPGRGTGLGLSICLAILREHNGQIQAQPLSDGGSVFIVTLPVATGTAKFLAESASPSALAERPAAASERLAGLSVLVVDNEESIRELVRDGLTARRMRVDTAASGTEALALMQLNSYDAVLCDLNLKASSGHPVSGFELYEHIRNNTNGGPAGSKPFVLFMTAEVVDGTGKEISHLGVRTLQKPFRVSELMAILVEALASESSKVG